MVTGYLGEIQVYAGNTVPNGWAECNGQLLELNTNQPLFSILGTTYGGNGKQNFALPDLRGCVPVMFGALTLGQRVGTESEPLNLSQLPDHAHAVSGLTLNCASSTATLRSPVNAVPAVEARGVTAPYSSNANAAMGTQAISGFAPVLANQGGSQPHENRAPFLALKFLIATQGFFPTRPPQPFLSDREPIVGEISMFAGNFAPSGWEMCEGQLIPIGQNTALFSLLGTSYGGNGQTNFALPNLSGKTPMMTGIGPAGTEYFQGEEGGVDAVTLLGTEIPVHTHAVASGSATPALRCFSGAGNASTPVGNVPAAEAFGATAIYRPAADASVMSYSLGTQAAGSGLVHNNRPPSVTINFIIAMQGLFPQRQ